MSEYYQHKDMVIRFDVFEDGKDVTPKKAKVLIYGPDKQYIGKDTATILGNEVRYIFKGEFVHFVGEYIFIFSVRIAQLGDYTHIIKAVAKKLPVSVKE